MIKIQNPKSKFQIDPNFQSPKLIISYLKHWFFGNWILFVICNLLIGILFTVSCFAEDINFEVSVDRTNVSLGKSLRLNLVFEGTQDISAPELPTIDGFDWHYLGPSTSMSVV
ncbi:MAG: hypothetical protein H8D39_00155, partial [Candidatus Atribacteria bacterium]|nr:hypothetical protein [Candidatus Atribacteria bacterium]